ncbi:hypothetical protein [Streptomyces niveus]|uniref:hypothetical protein n=1 Tax=Streptomyces niveus TaxID=193462 RepID=UPI0034308553
MRQRERTDVMRLKAFLREAVLPHTVEGRQVLEALGEADRLRNARIARYSTGDVILCILKAGHRTVTPHCARNRRAGTGCNAGTRIDERLCNHPHTAA